MGIAILYPVLAQIILTLVLMLAMGLQRRAALQSGEVTVDEIALDNQAWPERARKLGNCYSNQFELPVIFYVLCLIAQITTSADLIFLILAWIFVITRILHAIEHTTSNVVLRRGGIFSIGYICVALMTALLLFRFLLPPGL
jgi:hypothetical protein